MRKPKAYMAEEKSVRAPDDRERLIIVNDDHAWYVRHVFSTMTDDRGDILYRCTRAIGSTYSTFEDAVAARNIAAALAPDEFLLGHNVMRVFAIEERVRQVIGEPSDRVLMGLDQRKDALMVIVLCVDDEAAPGWDPNATSKIAQILGPWSEGSLGLYINFIEVDEAEARRYRRLPFAEAFELSTARGDVTQRLGPERVRLLSRQQEPAHPQA